MVAFDFILEEKIEQEKQKALEKEAEQKSVVALSGVMFIVAFVVAGLNFRYSWTVMPSWAVWSAVAVFLLSYIMYAEVLRENAYLSRTIGVQENQKVIDIKAKYLCALEDTSASFAVRVTNIPDANNNTAIYTRPYYIYENANGTQITVYGDIVGASYNGKLSNNDGELEW